MVRDQQRNRGEPRAQKWNYSFSDTVDHCILKPVLALTLGSLSLLLRNEKKVRCSVLGLLGMVTDTFIPCGSYEYITSVPDIMMGLSPEQGP